MKKHKNNFLSRAFVLTAGILVPFLSVAQDNSPVNSSSSFSNPLFNTLLVVIVILAIMIIALGGALKNIVGSDMFVEKLKKAKEKKNTATSAGLILFFLLLGFNSFGAEAIASVAKTADDGTIGGLEQVTFYFMIVTIAVELLVLGILFNTFKNILGANEETKETVKVVKPQAKTLIDKLYDRVELEKEETILLDHEYDGIRELDNNLPPWWKYGFYLTILVAVIYMINYHIAKTGPLQKEEYTQSIKKAEKEIAEYMKNSADNVDENTVELLTDAAALTSGKDVFVSNCAACHGRLGEGGVGPNLADEYWVHGGSVKDIFKTIKYGWPEKGMKSWKEDFSPVQIAQLTSFIRSLKGTNPPKAKEKQGELYVEQGAPAADSIPAKVDSIKVLAFEPKR